MTSVLTPWRPAPKDPMRFIAAYPAGVLAQVRELIDAGQLAAHLDRRYPERHTVQTDRALYDAKHGGRGRFVLGDGACVAD